jgi:DNA-binding GntR family transcriptional regulator
MKTRVSAPDGSLSAFPTDASPEPLKHRAYAALKSRIASGVLSPGALLSERQLAQSLKMSKTPVHAALERLEAEGLVTVSAQQGFVVRSITPEEIVDHFELRAALETYVVARLAGKLTAAQARQMKRNLADHRRALRQGDIAEHIRIDSEFHILLCECYGNKEITRAMCQIRVKLHRVMYHISTRFPERMSGALTEHEAIASSLVSGDGQAASEMMSTHLRNGLRSVYDHHP